MKNLQIIQNDDGVFDVYDDTYDITIHCTSQEEQDNVLKKLNREECSDAISRQAVLEVIEKCHCEEWVKADIGAPIEALQPVNTAEKVGQINADVLDKIRAEINKPVIRDEYSQRQNDYCDGYEFMCNRIKEIIDKYKASPTGAESEG